MFLSQEGSTPLHLAAKLGKVHMVQQLMVAGAARDAKDKVSA